MNKIEAMSWSAKLTECLADLPEESDVHGWQLHLNMDAKPYNSRVMAVQLTHPINSPAATRGKTFSGWHEMRVYMRPDLYVWWSEENENE